MNEMGVAFYISAFLISMSCIIYTFIQNRIDKPQKKFYLSMVMILATNTIIEAIVEFVIPHQFDYASSFYILYLCKYTYFVTHTAMLLLLGFYVMSITGTIHRFNRLKSILFILPILFIEVMLATNPVHHCCFSYDKVTLEYQRNWVITVLYILSAFYILFFIANLFTSWKAMTTKRRISLAYFLAVVIIGIIVQAFDITKRVELFAEAIAYLGLILTVEDEGGLLNADTGIYNRKALKIDIDNILLNKLNLVNKLNKKSFYVLCIKIENADLIRRVTGQSNNNILASIVVKALTKYIPRYNIYQTSLDTFVAIISDENERNTLTLVGELSKKFNEGFQYQNIDVALSSTLLLANIPNDLKNAEEVFSMADSSLPHDHQKLLVGKENFSYLLRRRAVENALENALKEKSFEVYYQPTFDSNSLKPYGAEALVRLHDENVPNLYPDEFISLAEQVGLIGDIDDYVLSEVCKFIQENNLEKLGIGSINVNLSVFQFTKPNFVDHINSIVNQFNIAHKYLNFEITESADPNENEIVKTVVNSLTNNGYRVYMDDYGTGYSNVHNLFQMNFDVIKIDKSILWGAEKSELGMIILENNIRMLKQIDLKIIVEGVETKEQVELLQKLGVDYLQGFYFSKAKQKEDFINFLNDYEAK